MRTLKIGIPIVVAQILLISMQFVDTVMAGHVSAKDLAALAIATALFHPLVLLLVGILMSVTPMVAQLKGSRKDEKISRVVADAFQLSLVFAVPTIFMLHLLKPLMEAIGYPAEVSRIGDGYLHAVSWGLPAILAYDVFRHFNEGLAITRPNMYFHILGLMLNILGNYTLMFGNFGFPAMGAVGAGWSTAMAWNLMLIMMFTFSFKNRRLRIYLEIRDFFRIRFQNTREILQIGIPNGFSTGAESGLFALVALMMGTLGVHVMAAHQIAINIAAMTFMVPLGISVAITSRIGHAVGAGEYALARYLGFSGIALCGLVMLVPAAVYLLLPEWIVMIYTSDPEVHEVAVVLLFMAAIFQLSDGLQVGALGALRGLKDTRIPLLTNIFSYLMIGLPGAYILGIYFDIGPEGLWTGIIVGLSIAALLHNLRFHLLTKTQKIEQEPLSF